MRGYEAWPGCAAVRAARFRIPMRGYEFCFQAFDDDKARVPNPHEGL